MENLIAIIKEGKVDNIIVASDVYAASLPEQTVNVTGKEVGIGYGYSNGTFTPPVKSQEELETEGRFWRDTELKRTDFIVPLTDYPNHAAWITYRQQLRDWTATADFPNTKPTAPAELK